MTEDILASLEDKEKLKEVREKNERGHWNLLVEAKKEPLKIREMMLAGIFQDFSESSLFFETTCNPKYVLAKYTMGLISTFGKAFSPLIPSLELYSNYDKHLEYMEVLKSQFYMVDKFLFDQVPSPSTSLSLDEITQKLKDLKIKDVLSRRIVVAIGSNLSLELMNSKEFVNIFQPTDDPGHAMRGRLGSLIVEDEPILPVVSDCMRKDLDKALNPDSLYWCDQFVANLKIRHNNTWDSINYKIDGVKGATEYGYIGTAIFN